MDRRRVEREVCNASLTECYNKHMSITTKTRVEKYLLTSIHETFDTQIDEWISGIEKHMNKMTDRQIIANDADATYYYDGTGKKEMMVDDFLSITSVGFKDEKTDVTSEDYTEYVFYYPANETPKYQMQMDNYVFPKGRQNIVVVGRKGYQPSDDIDEDLVFAATVLVAGIVNFSNSSSGEVKRETIGRYTVEYETNQQKVDFVNAMSIIKSHRRIR
jgi:hypothetical protein